MYVSGDGAPNAFGANLGARLEQNALLYNNIVHT